MSKKAFFLRCLTLVVVAMVVIVVIEIFWTFQPQLDTAVNYVTSKSPYPQVQVIGVISDVPKTQVILTAYDLYQGTKLEKCIDVNYVTNHLLSGSRTYFYSNQCTNINFVNEQLFILVDQLENEIQILAGISLNKEIQLIKGQWSDGFEEWSAVNNGIFFLFRDQIDVTIDKVVGFDAELNIFNAESNEFADPYTQVSVDYERTHIFPADNGFVFLGLLHSNETTNLENCIEMKYYSSDMLQHFTKGEFTFPEQRSCFTHTDNVSAAIGGVINGVSIGGGIVLEDSIKFVNLEWSDGFHQKVPVTDGFYFGQRIDVISHVVNTVSDVSNN